MNNQNKTNQITDWRIWNKNESNRLMLTVDFPSGKKWTMPLTECQIEPYRELGADFLLCENNYSSEIEQAVEYGDKFIVVKYPKNEKLYVMKSENVSLKPQLNLKNEKLFQYFTQVTAERICTANNKTEKVIAENVQRQLQKIIPSSDNALSAYCYAKNEARELPKNFIFPFGINENQLKAVLSAFTSQISVIEGPPGTGKTQTILNIVANILLKNEKVAIVSSNNEAVKNVYEKLDKENLGYLIAGLGNTDNKEKFFSNLRTIPKESKSTDIEIEAVQATFERLKNYLHAKNAAATLVAEIKEFETEKKYLKNWHSEHPSVKLIDLKKYKLSPKKITDLIVYIEYLSNKHVSFAERVKLVLNFRIFKTAFLNDLSERFNVIYTLQFYYYDKQIEDRKKNFVN